MVSISIDCFERLVESGLITKYEVISYDYAEVSIIAVYEIGDVSYYLKLNRLAMDVIESDHIKEIIISEQVKMFEAQQRAKAYNIKRKGWVSHEK